MSITAFLAVFSSGLFVGMAIIFLADNIRHDTLFERFGAFGRLLLRVADTFKRSSETDKTSDQKSDKPLPIDSREQKIYESSQAIRNMLLVLAASIQRTDKAASDSSLLLGDVKSTISMMDLPTDLHQAQSLLMTEVDRVISSNASLKKELTKSQAVLTERQHQIENLRTAVRIDGLTKVANRAYFDEKLAEMISLRKRYGDPFSLMIIDVDNFKMVNDTYGHQAGDRILKGISTKLKASLRGSDFLARYGGDEFVTILIKTDIASETEVALKLTEDVRASIFNLDDMQLSITLSIGVAEAHDDDTCESLLKRTDLALYRTKSRGRDGVSVDGE